MSLLIDLVSRCLRQMVDLLTLQGEPVVATVRADDQKARFQGQRSGERGASLVEYALLVALIAIVCVGAVTFFGTELTGSLSTAGDSINN